MQRLSIIIPLSGNIQRLEDTLVSVLENRPDNCQIVVVLNEVYADPYDLKNEVRFVYAPIGCRPVECLNRGLDAADGHIVHVLTAGSEVGPGWADTALVHFSNPEVAAVAPLILRPDDPQKVVSAGIEYRMGGSVRRVDRGRDMADIGHEPREAFGPDRLAGFYRKSAVDMVDRFSAEVGPEYCSADLCLKLSEAGMECVFEPCCRIYAAESIAAEKPSLARSLHAERMYWRWASRFGLIRSLPAHALGVAWEMLSRFPRPSMLSGLGGRMLGICGMGTHGQHRRRMAELRERSACIQRRHDSAESSSPGLSESLLPISSSLKSSSSAKAVRSNATPPRRLLG